MASGVRLLIAFNEKSLTLPLECAISLFRYHKVRPADAVLEVPAVYVYVQCIQVHSCLRRSTAMPLPKHVSHNGTPETVQEALGNVESWLVATDEHRREVI